jgi:vitellogenic carboxypeptidase-like protein
MFADSWNSFQVLIYNGQLDIIVAAALTERSLMAMDWKGSRAYRRARRKVWKIFKSDNEVAGYVRRVGKFHQVCKQLGHTGCRIRLVNVNTKHEGQ